jgi:NADH-quinone oxidoreductase subunit L
MELSSMLVLAASLGEGGGADPSWFVQNSWLIVLLPLVSAALITVFGKLMPLKGSEIGIATLAVMWVLSLVVGWETFTQAPYRYETAFAWSPLGGGFTLELGMLVDGLTAMMFVLVSTVSLMVHVYSREYMHGEERFTYFYAMLSLFTFSMLVLVIANNTLQAVVGWELVGLCSFLLIGFYWKEKPNQDAANKAFLTTKFADIGLIVGVIVLSAGVATSGTEFASTPFNIDGTIELAITGQLSTYTIALGCLMIFLGCVGKSGQMPLHVWLPDAMAGPTPVSALIHAATMVTAGVFFIARLYPVFAQSLVVMNTIAIVGVITLFLAGFVALVQDDIKKVLAYSTVSQLGYMMAALGVGGYTAGIFHLFTHGFFKALLFLGSGSLIHAVHSNNMSDMGGMRKHMPWTFVTFIVGSLALAGFPLTAGFFSKDEILVAAQIWQDAGFATGGLVYWFGLAGAMVTTFYMARACFLIFFGEHRGAHHGDHGATHDEHADDHATIAHAAHADEHDDAAHGAGHGSGHGGGHHGTPHESGKQILVPLVALMVLSFPVGFSGGFLWDEVGGSKEQNFETWTATKAIEEAEYPFAKSADGEGKAEDDHGGDAMGLSAGVSASAPLAAAGEGGKGKLTILHGAPEFHLDVFVLALGGFLLALGLAYSIYGRGKPEEDPTFKLGPVTDALVNKYYLDDLGYRLVVVPVRDRLSGAAYWTNQEVLDRIVKGVGGATRRLAFATYDTLDQKVIDGGVNGAAFSAAWWSEKLKRVQSGNVQRYAAALIAGTVVLLLVFAAS